MRTCRKSRVVVQSSQDSSSTSFRSCSVVLRRLRIPNVCASAFVLLARTNLTVSPARSRSRSTRCRGRTMPRDLPQLLTLETCSNILFTIDYIGIINIKNFRWKGLHPKIPFLPSTSYPPLPTFHKVLPNLFKPLLFFFVLE